MHGITIFEKSPLLILSHKFISRKTLSSSVYIGFSIDIIEISIKLRVNKLTAPKGSLYCSTKSWYFRNTRRHQEILELIYGLCCDTRRQLWDFSIIKYKVLAHIPASWEAGCEMSKINKWDSSTRLGRVDRSKMKLSIPLGIG